MVILGALICNAMHSDAEENRGHFQNSQKAFNNFQMPIQDLRFHWRNSFVLTPLANYLLIENGIIRHYVRSIDLKYRELFIKGEGTVEYFLRILKTTPTVFNAKNILVIRKF